MKTFILEDDERRAVAMLERLRRDLPEFDHVLVGTAPGAIEFLTVHFDDVVAVALDHDLPIYRDASGTLIDAGTGREVADWLAGREPRCRSNTRLSGPLLEASHNGTIKFKKIKGI